VLLLFSVILTVLASNKHLAPSSPTCGQYKHQATRHRQTDNQTRRIQLYGPFTPTVDAYISPEDREPEQKRVRVEVTLHMLPPRICEKDWRGGERYSTSLWWYCSTKLHVFSLVVTLDVPQQLQKKQTTEQHRVIGALRRTTLQPHRTSAPGSSRLNRSSNNNDGVSDTSRKAHSTIASPVCTQIVHRQTTCAVQTTNPPITHNRNRQQYRWLDILCHGTGMPTRGRTNE
jgi:hypothetical protein